MLDARFSNGKLWAVLGTGAEVEGNQQAGVAWFVMSPSVSSSGVSATIRRQGILALPDEALAYPTVGVTASGRGVIGFTRVGANLHPSYGYASIDDVAGVGPVHMVREGQSPQDGFTEYGGRFRWGDYGAAAVVGANVYLAGQYIEQPPCTVDEFIATDVLVLGHPHAAGELEHTRHEAQTLTIDGAGRQTGISLTARSTFSGIESGRPRTGITHRRSDSVAGSRLARAAKPGGDVTATRKLAGAPTGARAAGRAATRAAGRRRTRRYSPRRS